jgi:ribonuclease HI
MILHGFTDGASRGNPGESGIGVIVIDPADGSTVHRTTRYIGRTTNNVAEYTALVALLEAARALSCTHLVAHSDSELMVRQVNGRYRVKDPTLKRYYERVRTLLLDAPFRFELRHVPREQNADADRLANEGIDSRAGAHDV